MAWDTTKDQGGWMEKKNVRNGCVPSREGRSVGGIGHAKGETLGYLERFAPMHTPSPREKETMDVFTNDARRIVMG